MAGQALGLSLRVAAVTTVVLVVPGLALGWLLARKQFPGRSLLNAVVCVPLVVPPVATGYMLLLLLGRNGWLGRWLHRALGVEIAFTWCAAVLACAVVSLPLMVRSVRAAFESVDVRYEQASRTLRAGPWRTFAFVTLPLAWRGVLAGVILTFGRSLGEFGATITFAGNIPGRTRTLPVAAYTAMQQPGGQAAAMRLVGISIVLSVVVVLASEWLLNRQGGGKGVLP
jgi:molybdate transport system permease protein